MRRWWHPKVGAALVFCAVLATLISVWRIEVAMQGAVAGKGCTVKQLQGMGIRLEMVRSVQEVIAILADPSPAQGRTSEKSEGELPPACVRAGVEAQLQGDNFLLLAYSSLTLTLFLFVGTLRFSRTDNRAPLGWAALALLGLLLAVAMAGQDFTENQHLLKVVHLLTPQDGIAVPGDLRAQIGIELTALRRAADWKIGALALSAFLLAVLWPSSRSRLVPFTRLLAVGAAAVLALSIQRGEVELANSGISILTFFWLSALVQAARIAVGREEIPLLATEARVKAVEDDEKQEKQEEKNDPRKVAYEDVYPGQLKIREGVLIATRRDNIGLRTDESAWSGVGLSGGGIRSATFALGVFQALAKKRLLRHIDFLSTVSGGGYFGSFFGRLLSRKYVKTPADAADILLGRKQPEVMAALRENGRYLSPNGGGDSLLFGASIVRNWVSIHLVLGVFGLAIFLSLQALRAAFELTIFADALPKLSSGLIWWSPYLFLPILTLVLLGMPFAWAYWLVEPERRAFQKASRDASPIPPRLALLLVFSTASWLLVTRMESVYRLVWVGIALVCLLTYLFWHIAQQLTKRGQLAEAKAAEAKVAEAKAAEAKAAEAKAAEAKPAEVATLLPDGEPVKKPKEDPGRWLDDALYLSEGTRSLLGLGLTTALVLTFAGMALALIDSFGQTVYAAMTGTVGLGPWLAAIFSSIGALAGSSRWIAMVFGKGSKQVRPSLPMKLVAGVVAVFVVLALLVGLDAGAQAVTYGLKVPQDAPQRLREVLKEERTYAVRIGGVAAPLGVQVCLATGQGCQAPEAKAQGGRDLWRAGVGFAACFLISILWGQTWPFVNRSSHLPLYAARLTRAYLGASNERRWGKHNITDPVEEDDTDLARYWPPPSQNGAPVHLINVTINETIDGQSQVQQQDRKGLGLALGPWGWSAGARHHAVMPLGDDKLMNPEGKVVNQIYPVEDEEKGKEGVAKAPTFRVFDFPTVDGRKTFSGEALSLGTWLSISGAAFSTGIGLRTSLALSLLAGLGNVRLGRWWDSGIVRTISSGGVRRKRSLRIEDFLARLFPVQTYMLDEFVARFPGTARQHWYLSDGGHFENMGGYELLRRRLPFVLIVDGEMDADSTFEGIANLVRKARIDFGAEVRFLSEEDLDRVVVDKVRPYIGTLEQLKRGKWEVPEAEASAGPPRKPRGRLVEPSQKGHSLAHAALAEVTYGDGQRCWLLYVKPTLTGREPIDLLEYHAAHPSFPHEPTIDQYFDEAQWESYRRLGEFIGDMIFGELDGLAPGGGNTLFKPKPGGGDEVDAASVADEGSEKPSESPSERPSGIIRSYS